MKHNLVLLFVLTTLLFSCSSDKDDVVQEESSIVGSWELTALQVDNSTASDEEKYAQDILSFLSAMDCSIMTITFNADLSVITEDSGNYLEINVNPGGTGLDVPCPTQKDTSVGSYIYESGVLTYIDETEMETTLNVTISGNTMSVSAAELDFANFNDGGELIFTKR
jgi:hypothetical protein